MFDEFSWRALPRVADIHITLHCHHGDITPRLPAAHPPPIAMSTKLFIRDAVNYFQYIPNFPAAVFFAATFGLITIASVGLSIRYRTAYMWPLAMGTACPLRGLQVLIPGEVVGFTFRATGHFHPDDFTRFLLNQIFIVHGGGKMRADGRCWRRYSSLH
jgi:hypothetical protein